MSDIEQENQNLRNEMAALKAEMKVMTEQMTAQMKELMALKSQPSPPPISTQAQSTVLSLISTAPVSTTPFTIPESRPWGMPFEENRPLFAGVSTFANQQVTPTP